MVQNGACICKKCNLPSNSMQNIVTNCYYFLLSFKPTLQNKAIGLSVYFTNNHQLHIHFTMEEFLYVPRNIDNDISPGN